MTCPGCTLEIPDDAKACPSCAVRVTDPDPVDPPEETPDAPPPEDCESPWSLFGLSDPYADPANGDDPPTD